MRFIGLFIIAGVAMAQAPAYQEVATTAHMMAGLVQPTQMAIAEAAKDPGPADDRAWRTLQARGAMLQEAASLLLTSGRLKDQEGWVKSAKVMADVGAAVAKAAGEKNLAALQSAAGGMNASCMGCHSVYRIRPGGGKKK